MLHEPLVWNRNILPMSRCKTISTFQFSHREASLSKRVREEKHRGAYSALTCEGKTEGEVFSYCHSVFSPTYLQLSWSCFLYPLCKHRHAPLHQGAALAPKTGSFGRQLCQHHSWPASFLATGTGQILPLDLHPCLCSESQCRAGSVSQTFVVRKTKPLNQELSQTSRVLGTCSCRPLNNGINWCQSAWAIPPFAVHWENEMLVNRSVLRAVETCTAAPCYEAIKNKHAHIPVSLRPRESKEYW